MKIDLTNFIWNIKYLNKNLVFLYNRRRYKKKESLFKCVSLQQEAQIKSLEQSTLYKKDQTYITKKDNKNL